MAESSRMVPSHTAYPSGELASWRQLAARPRQLYALSCMGLSEVGELVGENGGCPHDPPRAVIAVSVGAGVAVVSCQRVRLPDGMYDNVPDQVIDRVVSVACAEGEP